MLSDAVDQVGDFLVGELVELHDETVGRAAIRMFNSLFRWPSVGQVPVLDTNALLVRTDFSDTSGRDPRSQHAGRLRFGPPPT